MMDLEQILEEAMARVDSMSADEFAAECIKAGYTPVRKKPVISAFENLTLKSGGVVSYRQSQSTNLNGASKACFLSEPANDSNFQLAA